jgi:hypothetical protein
MVPQVELDLSEPHRSEGNATVSYPPLEGPWHMHAHRNRNRTTSLDSVASNGAGPPCSVQATKAPWPTRSNSYDLTGEGLSLSCPGWIRSARRGAMQVQVGTVQELGENRVVMKSCSITRCCKRAGCFHGGVEGGHRCVRNWLRSGTAAFR